MLAEHRRHLVREKDIKYRLKLELLKKQVIWSGSNPNSISNPKPNLTLPLTLTLAAGTEARSAAAAGGARQRRATAAARASSWVAMRQTAQVSLALAGGSGLDGRSRAWSLRDRSSGCADGSTPAAA